MIRVAPWSTHNLNASAIDGSASSYVSEGILSISKVLKKKIFWSSYLRIVNGKKTLNASYTDHSKEKKIKLWEVLVYFHT